MVLIVNDNYFTLPALQIQKADTFVSTFWGTDQFCEAVFRLSTIIIRSISIIGSINNRKFNFRLF